MIIIFSPQLPLGERSSPRVRQEAVGGEGGPSSLQVALERIENPQQVRRASGGPILL